jgi:hypothetical protein
MIRALCYAKCLLYLERIRAETGGRGVLTIRIDFACDQIPSWLGLECSAVLIAHVS